ncbi:hypothetical protein [Lewinella sp. LCG006]|uniref:hypothetical protein n=1 Tax=Lewinella sp. LCG006 TaxID=3231911 RepID=UPI003460878A
MKLNFFWFAFLVLLVSGCKQNSTTTFQGKWQSLNDKDVVVEFKPDNQYCLYRKGTLLYEGVNERGYLTYDISYKEKSWFDLVIYNESINDIFSKNKIEVVNEKRIRIYAFKHHDILDVADEYYKVADFDSFDRVMKQILSLPESGS